MAGADRTSLLIWKMDVCSGGLCRGPVIYCRRAATPQYLRHLRPTPSFPLPPPPFAFAFTPKCWVHKVGGVPDPPTAV